MSSLTWSRRTPIGAEVVATPEQGVHVRMWAPNAKDVAIVVESDAREVTLAVDEHGYASGFVPGLAERALYRFRVDGALVPDPASRFQPQGPFGPSQVVDPDHFTWTDKMWTGLPADRHVVYELHIGTFTKAGTWLAACKELAYLAQLGVTTIEVMPINEFAGDNGWGYDGVNLFAPHWKYGQPDDFRHFVDRAHALGIAVILDVVYNHLGPDGNMLPAEFRHKDKATDWGESIDFSIPQVRELYIANAISWITEYHLDGLRFDATDAIHDDTILAEIITACRAAVPNRALWMVAEDNSQRGQLVRDSGFDALWNDDFHHSARVAATGVVDGYLRPYDGSARELVAALRHGFLYQGQTTRGTAALDLPRTAFVHFLENHDQVANLGFGERLHQLADPGTLRALTAVLLLAPSIPMLFQGQDTGSVRPWEFFCSHTGELGEAVRKGRAAQMAKFERFDLPSGREARRDPIARETFEACILDETARDFSRPIVALHRDLLHLRNDTHGALDAAVLSEQAFVIRFNGSRVLLVNLGNTFQRPFVAEPLLAPPTGKSWKFIWSSEALAYGGHGTPTTFSERGVHIPARAAVLLGV
ncbi:MAG: alpha-amylase family glycosyl hydrolase [Kofleriaceae bacterium]